MDRYEEALKMITKIINVRGYLVLGYGPNPYFAPPKIGDVVTRLNAERFGRITSPAPFKIISVTDEVDYRAQNDLIVKVCNICLAPYKVDNYTFLRCSTD
jgi:hypothetical protein